MSGCIIPRTPIAVDFWKRRDIGQARLFFLSHMHSDHTECLSSSWNQKIYCSEITKGLAIAKFNIKPSLLITLPTNESTILPLDEEGIEKLTVTAIDANHCPGALMFLFEGYFGRILYTADFRYFDGMLDNPVLNAESTITQLYLDNTYSNPDDNFPTRAEATLKVMEILYKHPSYEILFGLDTLGKEELLYKVAMVLGVRIVVDNFRYLTTKLMGIESYFTTDTTSSIVRVVRKHEVKKQVFEAQDNGQQVIAIIPSCQYLGSFNPYKNSANIFVVPYSDHSSFSELKTFVSAIKPQRIIPVVKKPRRDRFQDTESESKYDITLLAKERSDEQPKFFSIPKTVQDFMARKTVNSGQQPSKSMKRKKESFFGRKKKASGIWFPSPNKAQAGNDVEEVESSSENQRKSPSLLSPDFLEKTSSTVMAETCTSVASDERPTSSKQDLIAEQSSNSNRLEDHVVDNAGDNIPPETCVTEQERLHSQTTTEKYHKRRQDNDVSMRKLYPIFEAKGTKNDAGGGTENTRKRKRDLEIEKGRKGLLVNDKKAPSIVQVKDSYSEHSKVTMRPRKDVNGMSLNSIASFAQQREKDGERMDKEVSVKKICQLIEVLDSEDVEQHDVDSSMTHTQEIAVCNEVDRVENVLGLKEMKSDSRNTKKPGSSIIEQEKKSLSREHIYPEVLVRVAPLERRSNKGPCLEVSKEKEIENGPIIPHCKLKSRHGKSEQAGKEPKGLSIANVTKAIDDVLSSYDDGPLTREPPKKIKRTSAAMLGAQPLVKESCINNKAPSPAKVYDNTVLGSDDDDDDNELVALGGKKPFYPPKIRNEHRKQLDRSKSLLEGMIMTSLFQKERVGANENANINEHGKNKCLPNGIEKSETPNTNRNEHMKELEKRNLSLFEAIGETSTGQKRKPNTKGKEKAVRKTESSTIFPQNCSKSADKHSSDETTDDEGTCNRKENPVTKRPGEQSKQTYHTRSQERVTEQHKKDKQKPSSTTRISSRFCPKCIEEREKIPPENHEALQFAYKVILELEAEARQNTTVETVDNK